MWQLQLRCIKGQLALPAVSLAKKELALCGGSAHAQQLRREKLRSQQLLEALQIQRRKGKFEPSQGSGGRQQRLMRERHLQLKGGFLLLPQQLQLTAEP